jgi:chromosomal replication initiation ATPase DnaA
MARQLTFDLPVRPALGREDFFVSPANALALAALDNPANWPQGKIVLVGPEGAGKSHLVQVWASAQGATVIAARSLTADNPPRIGKAVVIEDADQIAGDLAVETTLFHLHNMVMEHGGRLLFTSMTSPSHWPLVLPDLASRMQATATAILQPPDDALLAAVLVKLFADRQLSVSPALIPWLVNRMDRSFAAAQRLVAVLDMRALAQGGAVTRTMAAEVLDSWPTDTP